MSAGFVLELGARVLGPGVEFRVWAPQASRVDVVLVGPSERTFPLEAEADGYFARRVAQAAPGDDYVFTLDGATRRPDPASRHQPHGVHGPSRVVDPAAYPWSDAAWRGRPFDEYVIDEIHVGTFTPEGSFDSAIARLPELVDVGFTALEIMPVAEFPGARNWGYDGAYPFAPQSSYGGPLGLKRLVDACHRAGLAVILDVVYNHVGPEGSYFSDFGPYFTDRYRTPWGSALNYDGPDSDAVRRMVFDNARYWLTEYHVDALRLDAIHGIFDLSARHLLAELQDLVSAEADRLGRPLYLIAESDLNDVRVIAPRGEGGHALAAQWSDDFHHALRTALGGDRYGYFSDFGAVSQLGKALEDGYVYDGVRSPFRRRRHGNSAAGRPGHQFVVYSQNHDQIANASQGIRLGPMFDAARERLAALILCTSPNTPLLFMGQEWGETNPFYYFVDHGDPELSEAVRRGRRAEMEELGFADAFADPTIEETFQRCKLDWSRRARSPHAELLALHRELLDLRRRIPALASDRRELQRVRFADDARVLTLERASTAGDRVLVVANLSAEARDVSVEASRGVWSLALATEARHLGGSGDLPPERLALGDGPAAVRVAAWSGALWLRNGP